MTNHLLIFFLFFTFSLTAQSAATLQVQLGIQNQKIVVTDATFTSELTYPADAKTQLVNLINNGFAVLDSLIKNDSMQWCVNQSCYPLEEFATDYLILTEEDGEVEEVVSNYFDNLDTWVLSELFEDYLFDILQKTIFTGTPLTLTGQGFEDEDYESFTFTFPVKAPIQVDKINVLWLEQDTLKLKNKNRLLKGLDGQLFFENAILNRLSNYYSNLSFQPEFFITPEEIRVLPPKISRFLVKTNNEKEVDKMAYILLPHRDYKAFLKLSKDSIRIESGAGEYIYPYNLLAKANQQADQLPILPSNTLGQTQAQLVRQGYSLNVVPTINNLLEGIKDEEQHLYLDLVANQVTTNSDTSNVQPATPNVANGDAFGTDVINDEFGATEEIADQSTPTDIKRNFIGLGVDFFLQDETRFKVVFQRLLQDRSNLSLEVAYAFNESGIAEGGLVFSGSYAKDYLFFNALKKRLSLQISAGSNFTANRVFNNEFFKERRTGGKVRTEIDWYRDRTNQLFQSYLSLKEEKVALDNFEETAAISTTIFSTEWGNIFYTISPIKLFTTRFKLENSLKFGWTGVNEDSQATYFSTGRIQANLNQKIVKGMAFDFTAYTEWNSPNTPFFEQIGHQVSVNRGFKEDAVIGRSLLGGTIEFWTPLPKFGNKASKLNAYFYKHLRLALFSDFSRYNKVLDEEDAVNLWSPGLGLRLLMPPVQINFDWAFRRSSLNNLSGGSQFSLNLILNSPFQ